MSNLDRLQRSRKLVKVAKKLAKQAKRNPHTSVIAKKPARKVQGNPDSTSELK